MEGTGASAPVSATPQILLDGHLGSNGIAEPPGEFRPNRGAEQRPGNDTSQRKKRTLDSECAGQRDVTAKWMEQCEAAHAVRGSRGNGGSDGRAELVRADLDELSPRIGLLKETTYQ